MDPLLKERKVMSPFFTGREDVLRLLDRVFSPRERGSSPRRDYLLWGQGGIGKTQIALRFADRFADRYVFDRSHDIPGNVAANRIRDSTRSFGLMRQILK